MSISEEAKKKIIENNRAISELLTENEKILREQGFDPPEENYAVDEDDKIRPPSGYIRPKEYLVRKYHLEEIASDWTIRSNIGYALQMSDFYNYLLNRVYFWGSLEKMIYKNAIINLVSVMEAIIFECAHGICCCPDRCKENQICKMAFSKGERSNSYKALQRINALKITDFTDQEMIRIKELIGLRNQVHLRLAKGKEYFEKEYGLKLYNEVISILQKLCEEIFQNGAKYFYRCYKIADQHEAEEAFQ